MPSSKRVRLANYQKHKEHFSSISRKYKIENPERHLANTAKRRAKLKNIVYQITHEDINMNSVCPILQIPIKNGQGRWVDSSPTLDRVDNFKGYTPENILVISWRANRLKSDATLDELILLGEWAKKVKNG